MPSRRLLLPVLLWCGSAFAQTPQVVAPLPADWTDECNVPGVSGSGASVCSARGALISYSLSFRQDTAWAGSCVWERTPTVVEVLGSPFCGHGCPAGYSARNWVQARVCGFDPSRWRYWGPATECYREAPVASENAVRENDECGLAPAGNPILTGSGAKVQVVPLGVRVGWLDLELHYDSTPSKADFLEEQSDGDDSYGLFWRSSLRRRLTVLPGGTVKAERGGGRLSFFIADGGRFVGKRPNNRDLIVPTAAGYLYVDVAAQVVETYDAFGTILRMDRADGQWLRFNRTVNVCSPSNCCQGGRCARLVSSEYASVEDWTGRLVTFQWSNGRIERIKARFAHDPFEADVVLSYDGLGNLRTITTPTNDGLSGLPVAGALPTTTRTFRYDRVDFPHALTAVEVDGVEVARYGFDGLGRANSTEGASGSSRYAVAYTSPPTTTTTDVTEPSGVVRRVRSLVLPTNTVVTLPSGATSTLTFVNTGGGVRVAGATQAAGSGCAASARARTFDSAGRPVQEDDFNGHRTCLAYSQAGDEVVRVEGLPAGTPCAQVLPNTASFSGAARKFAGDAFLQGCLAPADVTGDGVVDDADVTAVSNWVASSDLRGDVNRDQLLDALDIGETRARVGQPKVCWNWHVPTVSTSPGVMRVDVHHGTLNPFTNAVATCAPASTSMPRALLCVRYEFPTTDPNGQRGLTAQIDATVMPRTSAFQYNAFGQVTSAIVPGAPPFVATYYSTMESPRTGSATFSHHIGDVASVTSGATITRFEKSPTVPAYTFEGLPRRSVDGNGVETVMTYAAGRLRTVTKAGVTSATEWFNDGKLKRTTSANGAWVDYSYNAAGQVTQVRDSWGMTSTVSPNASNVRVSESLRDANGVLVRSVSRTTDALGRVEFLRGVAP